MLSEPVAGSVRHLHRRAMALCDEAEQNRVLGGGDGVLQCLRGAMELEAEAAYGLPVSAAFEPSRSILFRSAATLALMCGLPDRAQTLAGDGLAGQSCPEIRLELIDLLSQSGGGLEGHA